MSASWEIRQGDVLEQLGEMPDESVHCCITSPPYYGLRDYGTGEWEGGSSSCDHVGPSAGGTAASTLGDYDNGLNQGTIEQKVAQRQQQYRSECRKCGARRVDQQIGLEETPELFVAKLVEVFAEVRRVLRADGTLWLNLGDSYSRSAGPRKGNFGRSAKGIGIPDGNRDSRNRYEGMKEKDLLGIPWMVAFALRADGWYLRRDVIWSKPAPMPESADDRPTTAHEYVFLLTKSAHYSYDAYAIREPASGGAHPRSKAGTPNPKAMAFMGDEAIRPRANASTATAINGLVRYRNKRSVWEIATRPYPDAHYATFPPKLVEPMVLAGTAPKTCGECGAPWKRQIEKGGGLTGTAWHDHEDDLTLGQRGGAALREGFHTYSCRTTGWEPTCAHADGGGRSIVLDPFAGTGTTLQVAVERGRDAIGIELNPESVLLVEKRMAGVMAPLFAEEAA